MTVLPATHTTILTLLRKHSPDGTIRTRRHTDDIAYYSIYRPLKDERLSWPSWLTCSGRLTHISGHPSATGRAWDRKVRRSKTNVLITVPRNQPLISVVTNLCFYFYWQVMIWIMVYYLQLYAYSFKLIATVLGWPKLQARPGRLWIMINEMVGPARANL